MIWHVLGWLVLVSQFGGAGWLVRYMATHHRVGVSWEQRLPVPRVVEGVVFSAGSDFVGYV